MAKRSSAQKIGSQGQALVSFVISKHGGWLVREQPKEDFGVDMEVELAEPEIAGEILKLQVKTTSKATPKNGYVVCRIERKLLQYADTCRVPVVLVVVNLTNETACYLWLQEWIFSLKTSGSRLLDLPKTISIPVPDSNDLKSGLSGPLKLIATWKTKIQIALSLSDALRAAISLESEKVCEDIFAILKRLDQQYKNFPVEMVIAEVLRLGGRIWASEDGNRISSHLFKICRMYGDRFEPEQIRQIVVRGEAYSRTGITALGLLYDTFPQRMKKLKLQNLFKQDDPRVVYYCKFRERYLGKQSIEIIGPKTDFAIGRWNLDERIRCDLIDKWANRGDSAILDYLICDANRRRVKPKEAT